MARKLWHTLPGQHWTMSVLQEKELHAQLKKHKTDNKKFNRDDLTLLMSILRCGSSLDAVVAKTPGIQLNNLLNAYNYLDKNLHKSLKAWKKIEENPNLKTLHANAKEASYILPIPVHYALSTQSQQVESAVISSIAYASGRISATTVSVYAIERKLENIKPPSLEGIELGKKLYDPYDTDLYSSIYYKPDRVSSLTPLKVKDLTANLKLTSE